MATIANATGFEIPDILAYGTAGAGTAPTISSAHPRHGTYALRCAATSNTSTLSLLTSNAQFGWTGATRTAFRFGVYLETLPGTRRVFFRGAIAAGNFDIEINSSGVISAIVGTGTRQSGPTLSTGQYYVIEFEVDTHVSSAWVLRWRVDNSVQTDATFTGSATTPSLTSVQIGIASTDTFIIHYDDLAFSATAADYPIGNGYGAGYKVNASGTHNITTGAFQDDGGAAITAGETMSHTKLEETTPDTTTWVKQTTAAATNYLEYAMVDTGSPAETPQFLRSAVYISASAAAVASGNTKLHDATTDTNLPQPAASTTFGYKELKQTTRAGGQGAWTTAAIDALTHRVGYASSVASAVVRLSWAILEVDYQLAYTTTTPISEAGSVTPTGALGLAADLGLSGSDTPTGGLGISVSEGEGGSVTPTGSLSLGVALGESYSGSVTPTGSVTFMALETIDDSGSVTPTGSLTINVVATLSLSGSVTPTSTGLTVSPGEFVVVCTPQRQVLGCGTYQVYVLTRGAGEILLEVPWTTLDWSRVLDDTSDASVTVSGSFATGENRCKALAGVYPWEHELALYRDTYRVWSGPITRVENPGGGVVTLKASDLSRWLDERFIHTDHDYPTPGADVGVIFQDYIDDAMLPDNTPGLGVTIEPTGVVGVRSVKASEYQIAGAAIRELSRTGIDWTMLDRTMYAGGQTVPQTVVLTLLDPHLATPPNVIRDGASQQNRIIVAGGQTAVDGPSVIGEADDPASQALSGLLEGYTSESEIGDVPSATGAAQTRIDLVGDTPTLLESVVLDQTAPFTQDSLIAGILVDMRLTETDLGIVAARYRIASIKASADSSGAETITLNFQPEGTT